jgi:hypothetical protein
MTKRKVSKLGAYMHPTKLYNAYKFHIDCLYNSHFIKKIHADNALSKKILLLRGGVKNVKISANGSVIKTYAS